MFNDLLSIKITKSCSDLKLFVPIFLQSSISLVCLPAGHLVLLFNRIWDFPFMIVSFLCIYLYLTYLSWLWFDLSLCRLFLDYKGNTWICIDSTIIYGQFDEFQSRKLRNILYILGNIWYSIQFIYIWDTIDVFFRLLTRNWNVSIANFTRFLHSIISWIYSAIKVWFDIFEYLQCPITSNILLYTQYILLMCMLQ